MTSNESNLHPTSQNPEILNIIEKEALAEIVLKQEAVAFAKQAQSLTEFLYPEKGAFPNSLLFFTPIDAQIAGITPDAKFRLVKCLRLIDHQTQTTGTLEFALERVSPKTEQRVMAVDGLSTALSDEIAVNLNEKGGPKQIRFRVADEKRAEVSQTFRQGCEGGPINTRTRRRWPRVRNALLGLNSMIQEPWMADADALKTFSNATETDWHTIHQLLFGLNKAMVAELIKSGRMSEYTTWVTTKTQEQLHQELPQADETAEIPDPYSSEEPPETKEFSVNAIVERVNAEPDPLNKLRILQTAIEDITKATAMVMNGIPQEIQRESTDLFSTLKNIYKQFGIKAFFPGANELGSFYKGRQVHNATFESGKIEADPQQLWGGSRWQSKLRRLAHPDKFTTLDLEPRATERLEEISREVAQLLDEKIEQPDVIQLALLLHEIHSLTASQQALEAYQTVIPLFAEKAEQAIELLKQKVMYFNDLSQEMGLLDTGEHPLQIGTTAMREHLRSLINQEALVTAQP